LKKTLNYNQKIRNKTSKKPRKTKKSLTGHKPLMNTKNLLKPRNTLSRMRRGQLKMKPESIYEGQMVKRIRKKTGMTHIQVMNLVSLGKKSDYIDVETEISDVAGISKHKTELYEFAKKKINKKLERSGDVMVHSKYNDSDYYDDMQMEYDMRRNWELEAKKFKAKANLI